MLISPPRRTALLAALAAAAIGLVVVWVLADAPQVGEDEAQSSDWLVEADELETFLPDEVDILAAEEEQVPGRLGRPIAYSFSLQGRDERTSLLFEIHADDRSAIDFFEELPEAEQNVAGKKTRVLPVPSGQYYCLYDPTEELQCYGRQNDAVIRAGIVLRPGASAQEAQERALSLVNSAATYWVSRRERIDRN